MDKYKKLISNTIIFAISTFSSKVLVFLLMPLYTRVLDTSAYGVTDLLMNTGNLLLPLVTLGVVNAIIRFGLDREIDKADVFSTGLRTILLGFLILVVAEPFIVPYMGPVLSLLDIQEDMFVQNIILIDAFVLMSSMRSLCSQFIRARGLVRLFAVDGILSTVTTIFFTVLFLVWLQMGVAGYILATICADFLSVIFLFTTGRLHRFLKLRGISRGVSGRMLRYCVPLIPNTICWWITNTSSRYMVVAFLGSSYNGIFAAANKVPALIILVSGIFMDAWQMSAVTEEKGRNKFFTRVFRSYNALIFMTAAFVIMFAKLITKILVAPAYYEAWSFIPLLVVSTVFTCMVNFLGSIYMVEKKSMHSLATAVLGAVINVVLCLVWIPSLGVNGAALASLVTYVAVFLVRAVDTRRYIRMNISYLRLVVNAVLLIGQAVLMIFEAPFWPVWQALLTALMVLLNFKEVLEGVRKIVSRRSSKKAGSRA